MKKAWLSVLIAILIIPILFCSASAEEYADPRDSRYISPEVLDDIMVDSITEFVIKVYYHRVEIAFVECDNIEEILERYNDSRYIKVNPAGLHYYEYSYSENNEKQWDDPRITEVKNFSAALQEFQTMEAISAVSPEIVIESVYYIGSRYADDVIYYKTNLGDYVFYCGQYNGVEMLCTAKRFFEYMKADHVSDWVTFKNNYWIRSFYNYRSPIFNPNAPIPVKFWTNLWIGIGIVVLAAVNVYLIKRNKD